MDSVIVESFKESKLHYYIAIWGAFREKTLQIDWSNLGFGYHETDFMYISHCDLDGKWEKGEMQPFGPLKLSPSAGVLNYGQVCT